MFNGRTIAIATMHKKEQVIAPLIEKKLGMKSFIPTIDTDLLGTFSGEVERAATAIETASKKCHIAMDASGLDIAIASEGSFGSHPEFFFTNANEEIVVMIDRKNNQEFFGRYLTMESNFSGAYIGTKKEAFDFADLVGFPEHGLIVKDQEKGFKYVFKGIKSKLELQMILNELLSNNNTVWIETDMRAMYNPTRMKAIKKATQNLLEKVNSKCPVCHFPGFWVTEAIKGLACSDCGFPTKSVKSYKYQCKKCDYGIIKENPNGKAKEDPMYCDVCNP